MERRYETIDNNTLASLRKGHTTAFILLIVGISGIAFCILTIFLILPILLIIPFYTVINIGIYFSAVQEMRREKPGLAIGLVFGGIVTVGIWPLVHSIMHKNQITRVLKSRNVANFDSVKQLSLDELSTETLLSNKKYLKFGVLELVIAISVVICSVSLMLIPGFLSFAGYGGSHGDSASEIYGSMNNMMNGNGGWLYAIYALMRLITFVGGLYIYIKAALMSTVVFRQNQITYGVLLVALSVWSLGVWQYIVNKELNKEIDEILTNRGDNDSPNDPDNYKEPQVNLASDNLSKT